MHIKQTFQLIIKRLFLFQTSSTLQIIHTYQPPVYHSPFSQLFHHNAHTTTNISFPPSPTASNPVHCTSPLQTTQTNHLTQFIINLSTDSSQITYISHLNLQPKAPIRPTITLQAMLVCSMTKGLYLPF